APHAGDAFFGFQQRLGGRPAERADQLRFDRVDLAPQERLAGIDFVRFRLPVLRRPTLYDVGDVYLLARQMNRLQDLSKELSRPAHERDPLRVFIGSRPFADQHQLGLRGAGSEDDVRARLTQLASPAITQVPSDTLQGVVFR